MAASLAQPPVGRTFLQRLLDHGAVRLEIAGEGKKLSRPQFERLLAGIVHALDRGIVERDFVRCREVEAVKPDLTRELQRALDLVDVVFEG